MTAPELTADSVAAYVRDAFPGVDVVTAGGGTFFSLNPETHWPNFATLVTTDEFDDASDLDRRGVFRLNIGVGRSTFQSTVGSMVDPDFTELDRLLPTPSTRGSTGSAS